MHQTINKIGILVHHKVVFEHILKVLDLLEPEKVDLIIEDREFSSYGNQLKLIAPEISKKYNCIPLSVALAERNKWKVFIAFHPYVSDTLKILGFFRIRFMYGMGEGSWIFGDMNNQFDFVLTHGKYASNVIVKKYGIKCKEMGYPRYSGIKTIYDSEKVNSVLGVSEEDIVIVWFPTIAPHHSIQKYLPILSQYDERKFRIFVKPHPMTITEENKIVDEFKNFGITVIEDEIPIEFLYKRANITVHDVGGTALSALFLGKKPVFLKSEPEVLDQIGLDSPEIFLMKYCAVLDHKNLIENLYELSKSNSKISDIKFVELRDKFFSNFDDRDAFIAAKIIKSIYRSSFFWLYYNKLRYVKILRKSMYRMM